MNTEQNVNKQNQPSLTTSEFLPQGGGQEGASMRSGGGFQSPFSTM